MIRTIFRAPRARLAFAVGAAMLVAAGCKEATGNAPPKVASVLVTPDSFQVIVLHSYQLVVTPMTSGGRVIDGKVPTFQSSDATIANVSSTGLVVGIKPGAATITATVDGVKGTGKVVVVREPVSRISIEPPGGQVLFQGQTFALNAKVFDSSNNQLSGRVINWSSTNPGAATVAATTAEDARVTAVAPGQTTITASSEGANATVVITVTFRAATVRITPAGAQVLRIGGSLQLTATAYDTQNNPVQGLTPTWTSSVPQVAVVDPSTGKVTAVQPGSTLITVLTDNVSASVQVTVTVVPIKSVSISAASLNVFETNTLQFTATVTDSAGATFIGSAASQFPNRGINWVVADGNIAQISQFGLLGGVAPGTTNVTFTIQSANGVNDLTTATATVNVKRINTASVDITTTPLPQPKAGFDALIQAAAFDSLGRAITSHPVPISWSSGDTTIFTIAAVNTNTGRVTGIKAGTTTVTATADGKSATRSITIQP